ncbi:MAG: hypothetical protein U0930_19210 [Pirellulales bacterium]
MLRRLVLSFNAAAWLPICLAIYLNAPAILAVQAEAIQAESAPSSLILPAETVVYIRLDPLQNLIEHPLRKRIEASEAFQKIWKSPGLVQLRLGIGVAEFAMGEKLESVLRRISHGGIELAVDAKTQGAVIIASTENQKWLESYIAKLLKLAKDDAQKNNRPSNLNEADYRGLKGYKVEQAVVVQLDHRLLITNKSELAKSIIDRWLDKTPDSLSHQAAFQTAWGELVSGSATGANESLSNQSNNQSHDARQSIAKIFVDVDRLRQAGVAKELFEGKAKDFGAELLFGGLLANLHKTPYLVGNLHTLGNEITFQASTPHDKAWLGKSREFFAGPDGSGQALPMLMPTGTLGSLSAYRNVSQMWLRAGDLFDQQVNDQLASADNTLTTLFSGRDFGEDILGMLEPEMRLVASRQVFDDPAPIPAIKLPSFALVAKLKDSKMRPELKRIYQSFIGFLNVVGAQNGQPQFDLDMETKDSAQFYTASYVFEVDRKKREEAPIQFNFSPCLAFVDDAVILSSTINLAKQLAGSLSSPAPRSSPSQNNSNSKESETSTARSTGANTVLQVDAQAVKSILQDNRNHLISQNMLEKGHSKKEAEQEIDTLLLLVDLLENAKLKLSFHQSATLDISASLRDNLKELP